MPRGLKGSWSSFSSGSRRLLYEWSWQCLRVGLLRPFLFFFVFFTVEVLFLPPSNGIKKPKAKMKMKAKKTNSTSENAILLFCSLVTEIDSLSRISRDFWSVSSFGQYKWVYMRIVLTNHINEPSGHSCWAIKINPYYPGPSTPLKWKYVESMFQFYRR